VDVAVWLRSLGMERYETVFAENAIDADVLRSLTADDLKDLGIASVGHRRKLLDALTDCARAPARQTRARARTGRKENGGRSRCSSPICAASRK